MWVSTVANRGSSSWASTPCCTTALAPWPMAMPVPLTSRVVTLPGAGAAVGVPHAGQYLAADGSSVPQWMQCMVSACYSPDLAGGSGP